MGILLIPAHAHIVDICTEKCLQAVTYFEDGQGFRAYNLMAEAYRERNKFPIGTPAYTLCQNVIDQADQRISEVYDYFPQDAFPPPPSLDQTH